MIDGADLELFERSLRHANETQSGTDLDRALADLGWHDALVLDPRAAVSVHFDLQGRANTVSSALNRVVSSALGADPSAAVVLPAPGLWRPPGQVADGRLRVNGLAIGLADHNEVLVASASGDRHLVAAVTVGELTLRPACGLDPDLGLVQVTGDVALIPRAPADWSSAIDLARLALAHELVGASRMMLDLARIHALARIQFAQPIAGFQAVRHRLAETLVAIETAAAVLEAAWLDRGAQTAAMAKAVAGRGARTAIRHCQQVLAGIGFTTEHPFHRYVRRILVLDELFGATRTLTTSLGNDILATRSLPRRLPL